MLKDILDQKSSTMGYENEIPRPPRSRCYVRLWNRESSILAVMYTRVLDISVWIVEVNEWFFHSPISLNSSQGPPPSFVGRCFFQGCISLSSSQRPPPSSDEGCFFQGSIGLGSSRCYRFWAKHSTAHHLISLVKRRGDPEAEIGFDKLLCLSYGSPKIHSIPFTLHLYILPKTDGDKAWKLLITEDVPTQRSLLSKWL